MKRFWDTLDTQLFLLAGCLVLWAISVGATGSYPQGKLGKPAPNGDGADVVFLIAGAFAVVGAALFVRSIKQKRIEKLRCMNGSGRNPNSY